MCDAWGRLCAGQIFALTMWLRMIFWEQMYRKFSVTQRQYVEFVTKVSINICDSWHVRWWQLQNAVEWGSMEVFAKRQGNVLWMGVCRCSLWLWSRFGKCFARLSWRPESCAKRRFIDQKITGFHLTLADNSCKFWLKLMSGNSLWISISSVIALFRFSVLRKKSD